MSAKAYLFVTLKTDPTGREPIPKFCGIHIAGESGRTITMQLDHICFDLLIVEAASYVAACAKIHDVIRSNPGFAWVRPWFDQSPEAVVRRTALLAELP